MRTCYKYNVVCLCVCQSVCASVSLLVSVNVNVNVNSRFTWRKASRVLCTLVKQENLERKVFRSRRNCQRNVTDLAGSLVTSSRPPGRLQRRPDDRTSNAGVAVRTADGSRRTADAADEQCLRFGCNSPSCTVVLCVADITRI